MGFLDAFKTTPRPDNSPLIPLPNGTQLSQLILARTYKRWEFREEMLRSKLQRLEKATMAGETTVEGIGSVELRKEVRRCRVEARSIRIKLESALEWEFNKRRTLTNRDAAGRLLHTAAPPSLLSGFPLPVPEPPSPTTYTLCLPNYDSQTEAPPLYHEEVDVEHGEISLGRSMLRAITPRAARAQRWR